MKLVIPEQIGHFINGWPTEGVFCSGGMPHVFRPDDITEGFAVIAQRGAGKSNYAGVVEEILSSRGDQWIAIDPAAAHIGIRNARTKQGLPKGPSGLPVLIVGGENGDFPLNPRGGKELAQILMETKISCVIDLKHEKTADKKLFLTELGNELLMKNKTPLHLFLDEADEIIPQQPDNKEEQEIRAVWRKVIKRGRSSGLGFTILSQRAAMVDKTSLYQIQNLIVMQLSGSGDLDAVKGWFKHNTYSSEHMQEILTAMTSLKVGEAFLLSPKVFGGVFRIQVRERVTFHAGRTPKRGEVAVEAKKYEIKEVAALFQSKLEEKKIAVQQERDRSTQLAQENTKLKRELAEAQRVKPVAAKRDPKAENEKILAAVERAVVKRDRVWVGQIREYQRKVHHAVQDAVKKVIPAVEVPFDPPSMDSAAIVANDEVRLQKALEPPQPRPVTSTALTPLDPGWNEQVPPFNDEVKLKPGARRMLAALVQWHGKGLPDSQVASLAAIKRTSGSFSSYKSNLVTAGFIRVHGGLWYSTEAGFAYMGASPEPAPQTTEEMLAVWKPKLKPGAQRMLDVLIRHAGEPVTYEQLAEESGVSAVSGSFSSYLSNLFTADLIIKPDRGMVAAHKENLFL